MPSVNGYRGDAYPGGGASHSGPEYSGHSNSYDPYNRSRQGPPVRHESQSRDDPYNRQSSPYVEDPYSTRLHPAADVPYVRTERQEDPYGNRYRDSEELDPYSRVNKNRHENGGAAYQGRKPEADGGSRNFGQYEMDHLATFTVSSRQGLMKPADGIRKLRQMELSTGIWTMRVTLIVEHRDLVIFDKVGGQDEMERFPVNLVTDPTAVTNADRRDVYNNIVLFTVSEDHQRGAPSEMHIFQCISKPAHEVVDDIKTAKEGKLRAPGGYNEPVTTGTPVHQIVDNFEDILAKRNFEVTQRYRPEQRAAGERFRQSMRREDEDSVISEQTDRDVSAGHGADPPDLYKLTEAHCQQLLNHCFDDIEKFVGRLQQAADAFRRLDTRRKGRDDDKKNRRSMGDGMLSMRAQPPPAKDFIDIFQKFKLSFILLAKLKPHIHDPNAPELVHFLFTPLSLVVEASKDPRHGTPEIACKCVSPLLTHEARDLLINCLTSKEADLWQSLGDTWRITREEWKSYVPPYYPRFTDGWEPPMSWNVDGNLQTMSPAEMSNRHDDVQDPYAQHRGPNGLNHPAEQERYADEGSRLGPQEYPDPRRQRVSREHEPSPPDHSRREPEQPKPANTWQQQQLDFLRDLNNKNARAYEALHAREGRNAKELSIQKGEIVEVIDNTRNWWKVRNIQGDSGHVPYTILQVAASGPVHRQEAASGPAREGPGDTQGHNNYDRTWPTSPDPQHPPTTAVVHSPSPENTYYQYSPNPTAFSFPESPSQGRLQKPAPGGSPDTSPLMMRQQYRDGVDDPPALPDRYMDDPVAVEAMTSDPPTSVPDNRYYQPPPPGPTYPPFTPDSYEPKSASPRASDAVTRSPSYKRPAQSPERIIHNIERNPLQENLNDELLGRIGGPTSPRPLLSPKLKTPDIFIGNGTSPTEVQEWLKAKGFSSGLQNTLIGHNGRDVFQLNHSQLDRLAGDEASRLESQLTLSKNNAGYSIGKSSELQAVLRSRKEEIDSKGDEKY